MNKFIKIIAGMSLALLIIGIGINIKSVKAFVAATLYSTNTTTGTLATTTRNYIIAGGQSTTTLAFNTQSIDQVDFNFLVKSTSTPPTVKWRYEYSDNAVDWFSDDLSPNAAQATTSPIIVQPTFSEYQWVIASSTGGTSNSSNSYKHVRLTTVNSAFTRIVLYLAVGSTPADVWIEARTKNSSFVQ